MMKEAGNTYSYAEVLNATGLVYQDQDLHTSALEYCNEALILLDSIKAISAQKSACECLYNSYKALGRGSEALSRRTSYAEEETNASIIQKRNGGVF